MVAISNKKVFPKYLAAAIVVPVALSIGAYYYFVSTSKKNEVVVIKSNQVSDILAPTTERTTLTLSNGTKIILDSVGNGLLAQQGNIKIVKLASGELSYQSTNSSSTNEILYSTVATQHGGKQQVHLPDGSVVWLNAISSITYPTSFITSKERKVTISGEAYFEVAKNQKPFKVSIQSPSGADMGEVEVLGTHFNIMAYDDEAAVKTTLLEGSVKMSKADKTIKLAPGQQAMAADNNIQKISNANVEEATAWKDQTFYFSNTELKNVMRQLSRWYNVNIKYEGDIPERRFDGMISRKRKLSEVLNVLEKNNIHFRIESNTLFVTL